MNEWKSLNDSDKHYHSDQWSNPKRSTIFFADFISERMKNSNRILDLGAGAGGATSYLAKRFQHASFTAFDCSTELLEFGKASAAREGQKNLTFEHGNWLDMHPTEIYDGCISLQALSWFENLEDPMTAIFEKVKPTWIAATSLFYEGDISCRCEIFEHYRNRKSYYNTYSIPALKRLCLAYGYEIAKVETFNIDINIESPTDKNKMATYTTKTINSFNEETRLQMSGPLILHWKMILIEKSNTQNE